MMPLTVAAKVVRAAAFNKSLHVHSPIPSPPPPTLQCDRRCGGGASLLEALKSVFVFDDDWRRS